MDKFTEFEAIIKECDEIRIQDFLKTIFQGKFGGSKQRTSVDGLYILGSVELKTAEDRPMPILCCAKQMDGTLTERSSRRKQFDESVKVLKEVFAHPYVGNGAMQGAFTQGLFFFFDMDGNFRLSLVTSEIVNDKQELNNYRRQSFFVSAGARNNTFRTRICKKIGSYEDLKNAFDVEKLSDEFFREYKVFYEDIVQYVTGARYIEVKKNKYERTEMSAPNHDIFDQFVNAYGNDAEKAVRNYVKKLMGRLVFIQFLQKKGWLGIPMGTDGWTGGDKDFLQHLFDNVSPEEQNSFVDKVLEEVLFYSFNRKESERRLKNSTLKKFKFPFLNCGLFDKDRDDDFDFALPGEVFHNKKFHETERKAPDIKNWTKKRKPYFNDEVCGLFDFFDRFNFTIDENDPTDADVSVDPEMLGKIFENLLEDNKDKGAFYTPKEIVGYMCNESLIAYLESECPALRHSERSEESSIRSLVVDLNADSFSDTEKELLDQKLSEVKICDPAIGSGAFPMGLLNLLYKTRLKLGVVQKKSKNPEATLKREIIQQNIYGVDIEKGAVDIAQLRFWLSLVVDEVEPDALPNLEYKIMQGNSLLESFEGIDLSGLAGEKKDRTQAKAKIQTTMTFGGEEDIAQIQRCLNSFYNTQSIQEKKDLKELINSHVKNFIGRIATDKKKEIDALPLPNDKFFLWHTYFRDVFDRKGKSGFDIVIGNPPYGAKLSAKDKDVFRKLYPETQFKIDTYSLFVLHALNIMRNNGACYFIIPNTLLDNYFEELVRRKLLEENRILEINDLSDKVFSTAVVHSMIFAFRSGCSSSDYEVRTNTSRFLTRDYNLISKSFFMKQAQCAFSIRTFEADNLFEKLKENSLNLVDVLDIRQAIKSGDDKKEIVNEKRNDTYKPILRGKDIQRYTIVSPNLYLHYGNHLACPRKPEIFEQPKILIREAGAKITATYDEDNYYIMSSLYNAISKNSNFSLKYLLALIDSKLFQFIMNKLTFEKTEGAFTKAKIYHYYELPVKNIGLVEQKSIIHLVDSVLNAKKANSFADTSKQEAEIDKLIYELYGLTNEEIAIVEGREVASSTSSRKEVKTAATKDKVATSDDWLSGEEL